MWRNNDGRLQGALEMAQCAPQGCPKMTLGYVSHSSPAICCLSSCCFIWPLHLISYSGRGSSAGTDNTTTTTGPSSAAAAAVCPTVCICTHVCSYGAQPATPNHLSAAHGGHDCSIGWDDYCRLPGCIHPAFAACCTVTAAAGASAATPATHATAAPTTSTSAATRADAAATAATTTTTSSTAAASFCT